MMNFDPRNTDDSRQRHPEHVVDSRDIDSRNDDGRAMLEVKDAELGRVDRGLSDIIGQIDPFLRELGY